MIVVDAKTLSEGLAALTKVVQVGTNSPVYKCVMVIADGKQVKLRGTDQTVFIEYSFRLREAVAKPFVCLVVFAALYHYVSTARGVVTIDFVKGGLSLKTKTDSAVAKIRDPKDFMDWPRWDKFRRVNCHADELMMAVKAALPCVSQNMVTPVLFNVSLKAKKGELVIQSADGHRFQRTSLAAPKTDMDVLISLTAAQKLVQTIGDATEVGVSDNLFGLRSDKLSVYVLLSDGAEQFPDLGSKIVKEKVFSVTLDRRKVYQCLQRAIGFSSDQTVRDVKLAFKDNDLFVSAKSQELGKYDAKMPVIRREGRDYQVYVDGLAMSTFLQRIDNDKVLLTFAAMMTPSNGQIRIVNPDEREDLYVMYPIIKAGDEEVKSDK